MGQAKQRRMAMAAGSPQPRDQPLPKELIARAVRLPLIERTIFCPFATGTCVYQAEVGRRILASRYGVTSTLFVGDFMRPMGDGLMHTYTRDDGVVSVETGACHAWLYTRPPARPEYIDFAAWEAPLGIEMTGQRWTGPRPDYLWNTPEAITAQGYLPKVSVEASREVNSEMSAGRDADFVALYLRAALKALDSMLADPTMASTA